MTTNKIWIPVSLLILIGSLLRADDFYFSPPADKWGPVPARTAVVNPALRSENEKVISLRGTWDFNADGNWMSRWALGKGPGWREPSWDNLRSIEVPGCWEAQGVGEPGMSETWDPKFDCILRPLNHIYMGPARYRKHVAIPADWAGGRIWLSVGGVRTEAYIWVNHQRVARVDNYCGTYKFDVTDFVTPGEETEIVASVRNDVPSRKGQRADLHKYGGFDRDLELSATPNRWIDDCWVRGSVDEKTAEVHLRIAAADSGSAASLTKANIRIETLDGEKIAQKTVDLDAGTDIQSIVTVEMPNLIPWTPENPVLYRAVAELLDVQGTVQTSRAERFGVKKFEVRGDRFYLNNKPYFLRGYGDDSVYPMTIVSPADREYHLAHFRKIKEAGFNYVRLHTHCEQPEYFEAADEAGVMIQPELPYYHDITTEGFEFDPLRDLQELCANYRRYVSFAVYSLGNEGYLGHPQDQEIYRWVKTNDPDRLLEHQDGGCNITAGEGKNADFDTPNGYNGPSSILPWVPGAFDYLDVPFVAHEYMNLAVKMDPRLEPKFTGPVPCPMKMSDWEERLTSLGLDTEWGNRCIRGGHKMQSLYQKSGVEAARRDPSCDGFSYWTFVDVMVHNLGSYSGQGFLNAFYEPKEGGLTPKEFGRFNQPTILLAEFNPGDKIFESGEKVDANIQISHFEPETLPAGRVEWALHTGEQVWASGSFTVDSVETGFVGSLRNVSVEIPAVEKPTAAKFTVKVAGTAIENDWDFWLFPKQIQDNRCAVAASDSCFEAVNRIFPNAKKIAEIADAPENTVLVLGPNDSELLSAAIADNRCVRRVLAIGAADGAGNTSLGWWSFSSQLGTGFDCASSVFGDFPTEESITPLWFRIFKTGRDMRSKWEFADLKPLAVCETVDSYMIYAGIADQGNSPILATFGLDLTADLPEAKSLLANFIRYLAAER